MRVLPRVPALVAALAVTSAAGAQSSASAAPARPAPAFRAVPVGAAGGAARTLADYRGQPVLLTFVEPGCAPCRAELAQLQALHAALAPRGLRVVALSADPASDPRAFAAAAREAGVGFDVLRDASGAAARAYGTRGVPETVLIGRDGRVRGRTLGAGGWATADRRALLDSSVAPSRAR